MNHITGKTKLSYLDLTPLAHLFNEYVSFNVRADSPLKSGKDLVERVRIDLRNLLGEPLQRRPQAPDLIFMERAHRDFLWRDLPRPRPAARCCAASSAGADCAGAALAAATGCRRV
jgi:hypothetical protein